MVHPAIHLEIVRQRHKELLAEAERLRIANPYGHSAAAPTGRRRLQQRATGSRPASKPEIAPHLDVNTGLEA